MYTELIQLNEYCSAGCLHCPYSLSGNHLSFSEVDSIINESHKAIMLLSGGEPFEWENLTRLPSVIEKFPQKAFRIATGGHVDFNKKELLQVLNHLSHLKNFSGISMGTDILMSFRNDISRQSIWEKNIEVLRSLGISYSITITLGEDVHENFDEDFYDKFNHYDPAFFLIRSVESPYISKEVQSFLVSKLKTILNGDVRIEL